MNESDQPSVCGSHLRRTAIVAVVMMLGPLPALGAGEIPAFPGAQGWGTTSPGGRNGKVLFVTSLADSGPGTLRQALLTKGPRTILFRTSGTIRLEKPIWMCGPDFSHVTVAGQSAPGGGNVQKWRDAHVLHPSFDFRNNLVYNARGGQLSIRAGPLVNVVGNVFVPGPDTISHIPEIGLPDAADCWADPDNDGYGNLEEFLNGTDPRKADRLAPGAIAASTSAATTAAPAAPPKDAGSADYFPPPESKGGWRKLESAEAIRRVAGMEPAKLDNLKEWLLQSDRRDFAAVVIRRGYIVLEVERGNSAKTDSRRVASVSKAICATVLAIASEQSQQGLTPRKMKFDDRAFDFIPWAHPLSDPRKARITVKQLLNHTSGLCPEATGAPNDGTWQYVLGLSGDPRTAKLAFEPGTACGYSTHALDHAALVCETVTGKPFDQFAIESLFKPIGVEHWWFQYFHGGEKIGRHPTHGLGMPARDLARIGYCMARGGRWGGRQVVPKWFVDETAAPTHKVQGREMRFQLNARTFSHGWELPAQLTGEGGRSGKGIPADARHKPGSGGQLIAFVPSLDLVITRQTGSSGEWQFEEYLRRACQAVLPEERGQRSER